MNPVDLVLKMSYFNGVDKGEGKEIAYFCIYSIFNDCSLGADGEPLDVSIPTRALQKVAGKLPLIRHRHGTSVSYHC